MNTHYIQSQSPPIITTLRADIVPHREMAIRKWYTASRLWYYHRRALTGEIIHDERASNAIDDDLRPLCRLLHEHDIVTAPSCHGHFFDRRYFEEVWSELEREEEAIQTHGLLLADSSDGREFIFRAQTYQLPWLNFSEFYSEAAARQTQGYIGVLLPRLRSRLICELHNHPYRTQRAWVRFDGELSCVLGGSLFGITVHPRDPAERRLLWNEVANYFRGLLTAANAPASTTAMMRSSEM